MADASRRKEKPPEGGSQSNPMIVDQAALNDGFDFHDEQLRTAKTQDWPFG
jgi:hypothetical protein